MRSSYKKHTNDLKWSQNIAKNPPSKSWRLQLSCCVLIHQPPEKPLGCLPDPIGWDPSSLNGKAPESCSWIQIHHHWRVGLAYRRKNIQGKAKGSRGEPLFFIINDDSHGNYPIFFFMERNWYNLSRCFFFSLEIRKTSFILFETNLPIFWIPSSLGFLSERRNSTRSIRLQWCANLECQRLPRSRFRR